MVLVERSCFPLHCVAIEREKENRMRMGVSRMERA
jgi:hypothetical protein